MFFEGQKIFLANTCVIAMDSSFWEAVLVCDIDTELLAICRGIVYDNSHDISGNPVMYACDPADWKKLRCVRLVFLHTIALEGWYG